MCLVVVFLALWDGLQESCSYRRVQEWFSSPPVAPPALPPAASLKLILGKLRASPHKSGSRYSFFTFTFISFGMIFAIKRSKLILLIIFLSVPNNKVQAMQKIFLIHSFLGNLFLFHCTLRKLRKALSSKY